MNINNTKYTQNLFIFLGLVISLFFSGFKLTTLNLDYLPGDFGDMRFNIYILEHGFKFFKGEIINYMSAPFMYPERDVITYSDNLLGVVPFYSVFRLIKLDRETSFQCLFLLIICLNYFTSFKLFHYILKNYYAAILGAFVFSSSVALQSQIGHFQTMPRFALPIIILMCFKFFENFSIKYFLFMVLAFVYQIYCGFYLGFLSLMPLLISFICLLAFNFNNFKLQLLNIKWVLKIAFSLLLGIVCLLPIVIPYKERAEQLGQVYSYEQIVNTLPTLQSFFYSSNKSLLWFFLENTCDDYEGKWDFKIFVGGITTIALLIFIVLIVLRFKSYLNNNKIVVMFFTAIFTFLLFTKFNGFSFYQLIYYIPGFTSMRALQRIINIELLFFGFAVSFVFNLFFTKPNIKLQPIIFCFCLLLLVVDFWTDSNAIYRVSKSASQNRIKILSEKLKACPKKSVVSFEPDSIDQVPSVLIQLDAMLASQDLSLSCINGYSGYCPFGFSSYWMRPDENSRKYWLWQKQKLETPCYVIH